MGKEEGMTAGSGSGQRCLTPGMTATDNNEFIYPGTGKQKRAPQRNSKYEIYHRIYMLTKI
jgi:hypothetical protein